MKFSIHRYKVFRTQKLTSEQAQALQKLEDTFDFWTPINPGTHSDVLAPPYLTKYLQNIFHQHKIGHYEYIENVEGLIQSQTKKAYQKYDGKINFDQYYSHDDVIITQRFSQPLSNFSHNSHFTVECIH